MDLGGAPVIGRPVVSHGRARIGVRRLGILKGPMTIALAPRHGARFGRVTVRANGTARITLNAAGRRAARRHTVVASPPTGFRPNLPGEAKVPFRAAWTLRL